MESSLTSISSCPTSPKRSSLKFGAGGGMVGKRRYTLRTILRPPAPLKGCPTGSMCGKNVACPGVPLLLSLFPNGYAPQRGVHRVLSSEGHRSGGDRDAMDHEDAHEEPRADAPAFQRLHARLSECSIQLRFFGPLGELSEEMTDRLARADDTRTDTQPRAVR